MCHLISIVKSVALMINIRAVQAHFPLSFTQARQASVFMYKLSKHPIAPFPVICFYRCSKPKKKSEKITETVVHQCQAVLRLFETPAQVRGYITTK